jgi:membrane protease YdiL (CAAX protease family)
LIRLSITGEDRLTFPTLFNTVGTAAVLVVGIPLIYLLSKALKLHPKPIAITEPRKEVILVFLVVIAVCVGISVRSLVYELPPWLHVDAIDVLVFAFYYTVLLLSVVVAMKVTGQSLESIGVNGKDKGRMVVLGLTLSVILFIVQGLVSGGRGFTGFSPSLAYGFIFFVMVGFSEELIWRGYIQTRLIAYGGTLKGYLVTSLLFALWHFPLYYYGVALEALAHVLIVLFPSLLFGYVMLRAQNIIPCSIFHLFLDWNILFWQIRPS